ncbi:MAG: CCA tRNA nucleotidyltransferase [Acidobacteria bacterium]|nr:MAG: CCA tRNA nucleotidyltransferase [Acidobacteriota bacterium]
MTDYNFLMESRLSPAQFQLVNELARIAYGEGINLYLVGGAVRDMTFGQAVVRDLDFAAEGNIHKILRHLLPGKGKVSHKVGSAWAMGPVEVVSSRIDDRRGSAEVWLSNGVRAEIAQCHQEIASKPGHPPEIRPAMIFEDLKCRDFAFNAMAISLHPNSRGLLLDPKNGAGDIERQEIRVLHSRSFWDDPVRIYRLLRLGLRFGFKPEEKTQRWLDAALEERTWAELPPAKQAGELEAVLHEDNPERVLKLYQDRGILVGLDRSLTRVAFERFRIISALAKKSPGEDMFLLNFDCLATKLNTSQRQRLAKKVIPDPGRIKLALSMDHGAKKIARLLSSAKCGKPSQAYKVLSQQPRPLLLYLLAYYPQAKIQSRIKDYMVRVPQIRSRLPESELLVLGVKPGPKFDKILERIFFDQLDGKIKTHQQLAQELRSLAGIKEPPAPPIQPVKPTKSPKSGPAEKSLKTVGAAKAAKVVTTTAKSAKPLKVVQPEKEDKSVRGNQPGISARTARTTVGKKKRGRA